MIHRKASGLATKPSSLPGGAGARTPAAVMPAAIGEARDKLARGVTVRGGQRSPSTLVRYLAVLSHGFAVAVKQRGSWPEDSPLHNVYA